MRPARRASSVCPRSAGGAPTCRQGVDAASGGRLGAGLGVPQDEMKSETSASHEAASSVSNWASRTREVRQRSVSNGMNNIGPYAATSAPGVPGGAKKMARRKGTGAGGVVAVIVLGALAMLMAIPKEVWIGAGVLAAIGFVAYLVSQSKKTRAVVEVPQAPRQVSRPAARSEAPAAMPVGARAMPRFVPDDSLVDVARTPSAATAFKVPAAPKGLGVAAWVPVGQSVSISDVAIPGGMLYVGTSLPTPHGAPDPCLIDPSKSVARQGDYTKRQMGYWPSYSEISGEARRAYLNWLAGGRKDPEADIGYRRTWLWPGPGSTRTSTCAHPRRGASNSSSSRSHRSTLSCAAPGWSCRATAPN